jgi:hypothetical protein
MPNDPIKKQAASVITDESHEEQIRRRAYELYEECGCEDGHDVEHWLRAEAEIMGTSLKAAA